MSETRDNIRKQQEKRYVGAPDLGKLNDKSFATLTQKLATENRYTQQAMRTENTILFESIKANANSSFTTNSKLSLLLDNFEKILSDVVVEEASFTKGSVSLEKTRIFEEKLDELIDAKELTKEQIEIAKDALAITKRQVNYENETRLSKTGMMMDALKNQLPSITGLITGVLGNNVATMFAGGFIQDIMNANRKEKDSVAEQESSYLIEKARLQREEKNQRINNPVPDNDMKFEMPSLEDKEENKDREEKSNDLLEEIAKNTGVEIVEKESFFSKTMEKISDILLTGVYAIGVALGGVAGAIALPFNVIIKTITGVSERFLKTIGIFDKVQDTLKSVGELKFIKPVLEFVTKLKNWFGLIVSKAGLFGTLFEGILKGFGKLAWPIQAVLSLIDFVSAFKDENGDLLDKIYAGVESAFRGFFELPLKFISWVVEKTAGLFNIDIEGQMWPIIDKFITNFFDIWENTYRSILDGVSSIPERIKTLFNELTNKFLSIKDNVSLWLENVDPVSIIKDAVSKIEDTLTVGYDNFVGFIEENNPINLISDKVKDIISSIQEWIDTKFDISFPDFDLSLIKDPIIKSISSFLPDIGGIRNKFLEKMGVIAEPEQAPVVEHKKEPELKETMSVTKPEMVEDKGVVSKVYDSFLNLFKKNENKNELKAGENQLTPMVTKRLSEEKLNEKKQMSKENSTNVINNASTRTNTVYNANKSTFTAISPRNNSFATDMNLNF